MGIAVAFGRYPVVRIELMIHGILAGFSFKLASH